MNDLQKKADGRREAVIYIVLCILGILFYCTRFFMNGIPYYHYEDLNFHMNRLLGMGNVWKSPVNFFSFLGDGTYVNIYYPWLTMYPMWILYKVCGSYVTAYNLYNTLLGIATLLISYKCMKRMVRDDAAAICFSVLYSFSSYRFANVFRRAAMGESIAMTLLPIVLLGVFLVFFENDRQWRILSFGMTLLSYTHLLSLLMGGVMVGLVFLISFYRWDRKAERLRSFAKSIAAAIAMSLGALIPILQASLRNNIFHPQGSVTQILKHTDSIAKIIENSILNRPTAHSLGLMICAALGGTFFLLVRNKAAGKERERELSKLFIISGLLYTAAGSSLIPWKLLGRFGPLQIIQFPWRLFAYATLLIAAAFSFLSASARKKWVIAVIVSAAGVFLTWSSVFRLLDEEEVRYTEQYIREQMFSSYDYVPQTGRNYAKQNRYTLNEYYLDGNEISPVTSISEDGGTLFIELDEAEAGRVLDVPVYWFSSVRARVNGEEIAASMSERGTVLLTVPSDGRMLIEIWHVYDKWTYILWGFSFTILLLLIAADIIRKGRGGKSAAPYEDAAS